MIELSILTTAPTEMIDVTPQVQRVVDKSGVEDGVCTVFVPHTTAGLTINENADPDVHRDILMELNHLVPLDDGYAHSEGNSAAHVKASLMGCSLQMLVQQGRLVLGTWQGIHFCEFDGPRSRRMIVDVR